MKNTLASVVTGVLLAGMAAAGENPGHHAEEAAAAKITPQTTCPVMGGKISRDLYVDHDGKRVYVCCKECVDAVKKNPQKYIKKLEDQGVTVARLQTTCPVMGGKVNRNLYVDHAGKRVYVCCKGCIEKVKADPAAYIEKLEREGLVLDKAQ